MIEINRLKDAFSDLKEQAKEDCKAIDKVNIDVNFKMSALHYKWLDFQHEWKRVKKALNNMKLKTTRELYQFYVQDFDLKLTTKEQIYLFIESDNKHIVIKEKLELADDIIDFCISVSKILENKNWEIKHYLTYLTWRDGVR